MTKKNSISFAHRIAGVIALIILLVFWFSTIISELTRNVDYIRNVKCMIPYGFILLIPALIIVGGTGFKMARKSNHPVIRNKKKRMPFIALNGLFILIPCALSLRYLAIQDQFNMLFLIIQIIELIAGGTNILLLILNIRAGIKLVKTHKFI